MALFKLLSGLAAISLVSAQSTNMQLQIEAIVAHFTNAQLIPVPIPAFNPSAILTANFGGVGSITPGQPLSADQVQAAPTLTLTPANSTVTFDGNYTVAMVDPGAVGSSASGGQTRHWLVNGATIANGTVSIDSGTQITQYAGPAPPAGTGPHRYTIVIYSQPDSFTPPADLSSANVGVSTFDFPTYVQSTGLGPVVAGIYYTVEEGTATVSIPVTSPVVTSTLPAAGSSGTSTSTGPSSSVSSSSGTGGAMSNSIMGSLIGITALLSYIIL
jgi:hypothetical protein